MSGYKWEPVAREYNPLKAGSIDGTDTVPHDHGIIRAMEGHPDYYIWACPNIITRNPHIFDTFRYIFGPDDGMHRDAEYKPNKLVVGDPKATVFVGRLNRHTTESTVREIFSRYGKIKKLRLVRDIVTGFSRGYAFVEYHDKYDAQKAQRELNKTVIDSKEILVDSECERLLPGWVPRRLGGGLGGKKESGQLRFGGKDRPFKKPILSFNIRDRRDDPDSHSSHRNHYHSRDKYSDKNRSYRKGYDW